MKSIGVDIGSSHVKVVEVQSASKGFHVANYQIHPLTRPPGTDQDIEIIEFLRDLATKYDATTTRFNFAIRQDRVAIRNKIFPFNDRTKINKSLAFELEEDIPFSSDTAVFDSKIVQYYGNSAEVLACAVPHQHIKNLLSLLGDSGIDPYLISTEGPALANIFERWNEPPPQHPPLQLDLEENAPRRERPISIVLSIGHSRTLVCALENNQLVGVRSILWGGQQIVEAIAKKYNLPPREAQKEMEAKAFILHTKQESNFEAKVFSDLIAKSIRDLGRDLQLVLLEFKAEFNGQIERVDMTGGVSMIQGLGPFMTQLLEVPVNRLATLNSFPNVFFEKTDLTQSRLGGALGLAIEGLKKPRNPAVNFLKGEFAKQSNILRVFWQSWGPAISWSAATLVILFAWSATRSYFAANMELAARNNLKQQAKNVAGLTGRGASEGKIKDYIRDTQKRADELKKITNLANMNSAMEVFKKINDATPSKSALALDLRILNINDGNVHMEGYLNSPKELSLLQQALTNVAEQGRVQNLSPRLSQWKSKTTFALSFSVDRNTQKGKAE